MTTTRKRGLSVLVVDDNASMRAALRGIVKGDGHDVIGEAAEGNDADPADEARRGPARHDDARHGRAGRSHRNQGGRPRHGGAGGQRQSGFGADATGIFLGAIGYVTKPLNPDRILQTFEQIGIVSKSRDGRPAVAAESSGRRCVIVDSDPALRGLRAVHPDLQVIMATAHAEGAIVKEALSQRVAGYLLKPVDATKVLAAVRKALGNP